MSAAAPEQLATPAEIRRVLVAVEQLSRLLCAESNVEPMDGMGSGQLLHGLVQGLEGVVYPVPDSQASDLGYRVGRALMSGGSPWA